MAPVEKTLEKNLYCNILIAEGIGAIGTKPRWNRDNCPYYTSCVMREYVKKTSKILEAKTLFIQSKNVQMPGLSIL
jgi:hypothetical protein